MKNFGAILFLFCLTAVAASADTAAIRPFSDYQIILDRKPFGDPAANAASIPEPIRNVTPQESFAANLKLTGIYELKDGTLKAAITDKKSNKYFSIIVEETDPASGITLLDLDYEKEEVTLQKGSEVVVLAMRGDAQTTVLSNQEQEERAQQAAQRRQSYAERRKQRMLERQKPVEIPEPKYTGAELEEHLQNYQMEVIRQGLPPLPVQLTADRDEQLVEEGYLAPTDAEGFELEYDEYYGGYYDEDGNYYE